MSEDAELTPLCARCGEHAEPWPFACPECGRVHHARCWRVTGGCSACGIRTHVPRGEAQAQPSSSRGLRWRYLRAVAFVQQRLGLPIGPAGLAALAVALLAAAAFITTRML